MKKNEKEKKKKKKRKKKKRKRKRKEKREEKGEKKLGKKNWGKKSTIYTFEPREQDPVFMNWKQWSDESLFGKRLLLLLRADPPSPPSAPSMDSSEERMPKEKIAPQSEG